MFPAQFRDLLGYRIISRCAILESSSARRCAKLLGLRLTSVAGSRPYKGRVESRLDKAKVVPSLGYNHSLTFEVSETKAVVKTSDKKRRVERNPV